MPHDEPTSPPEGGGTAGDRPAGGAPANDAPTVDVTAADLPRAGQPPRGTVVQSPEEKYAGAERSKALEGKPSVPGYQVERLLGRGSYGEVWLAEEDGTHIRVAIKFFVHGTGRQWQRLQEEVKRLADLDGVQGIVHLKDVAPDATPPYYVMAFAENGSLAEELAQKGALPLPRALAIFRQVAEALAYVHAKAIRHCDLKPGNILLDARSRAMIADFSQAYLSREAGTPQGSLFLGTLFYMPPEQADLDRQIPDTRWDVYGLGALFYCMLTGRPPREDSDLAVQLAKLDVLPRLRLYRQRLPQLPDPAEHRRVPDMDRGLADIIDRCLAIDPAWRFRDAGAVLEALDRRDRQRRQRPFLLFGVLAPVLLLLLMTGLAVWSAEAGIRRSRATLTERLETSDLVMARLVADAVGRRLTDQVTLLEREARDPRLVKPFKEGQRDALRARLDQMRGWRDPKMFSRWLVADRQGFILAITPDVTFPNISYQWRDWFSGGGDRARDQAWPPITQTYVSQPYVTTAEDRRMFFSISTPILDADAARTILGVLMVSLALDDLPGWIPQDIDYGFAVLLNERGNCLVHQAQEKIIAPTAGTNPKSWLGESETFRDLLVEHHEGKTRYTDPIDGKTYLAGYAPVPGIGWGVLVQHAEETALEDVEDLKRSMLLIGLAAVAVAGLLTLALWVWLFRALRRGERPGLQASS